MPQLQVMHNLPCVLVVDDNEFNRYALKGLL